MSTQTQRGARGAGAAGVGMWAGKLGRPTGASTLRQPRQNHRTKVPRHGRRGGGVLRWVPGLWGPCARAHAADPLCVLQTSCEHKGSTSLSAPCMARRCPRSDWITAARGMIPMGCATGATPRRRRARAFHGAPAPARRRRGPTGGAASDAKERDTRRHAGQGKWVGQTPGPRTHRLRDVWGGLRGGAAATQVGQRPAVR